jgi:threonine 3-dehydrogenase
MSGHPMAIRQGFQALRKGGTAALLGLPSGEVQLNLANSIIFKGATVLGINGRRVFETWFQMEQLLVSGRVNLAPIITDVVDMRDYESAFERMQKGDAIKTVFQIPTSAGSACPTANSTSGVKRSSTR